MGFFDKLKQGLSKTKNSFEEKMNNVFSNFRKVDDSEKRESFFHIIVEKILYILYNWIAKFII